MAERAPGLAQARRRAERTGLSVLGPRAGADIGRVGGNRADLLDAASIMRLQRLVGNNAVVASLQRSIGWPTAATKNASAQTIGGTARFPVAGLSGGLTRPTGKRGTKEELTDKASKETTQDHRAIVLIPKVLVDAPPKSVDVLLHLHGQNVGWREGKFDSESLGSVKDKTRDESTEDIVGQLGDKTVAVLPQGSGLADFGNVSSTSTAYMKEALGMVSAQWAAVTIARVILTGHSGAGGT